MLERDFLIRELNPSYISLSDQADYEWRASGIVGFLQYIRFFAENEYELHSYENNDLKPTIKTEFIRGTEKEIRLNFSPLCMRDPTEYKDLPFRLKPLSIKLSHFINELTKAFAMMMSNHSGENFHGILSISFPLDVEGNRINQTITYCNYGCKVKYESGSNCTQYKKYSNSHGNGKPNLKVSFPIYAVIGALSYYYGIQDPRKLQWFFRWLNDRYLNETSKFDFESVRKECEDAEICGSPTVAESLSIVEEILHFHQISRGHRLHYDESVFLRGLLPFSYKYLDKCIINPTFGLFSNTKITKTAEDNEEWISFVGGDGESFVDIKLKSPCQHILISTLHIDFNDFIKRLMQAVSEEENRLDFRVPLDYRDGLTMKDCKGCRFSRSCDFASKVRHFIFTVTFCDEDIITALATYTNSHNYYELINRLKGITEKETENALEELCKKEIYSADGILFYIRVAEDAISKSEKIATRIANRDNYAVENVSDDEPPLEEVVKLLVAKSMYEQGAVYPAYNDVFCGKCGRIRLHNEVHCPNCGEKRKRWK